MTKITMRGWQARFARKLAAHRRPDFLLVACPAAGKTRAAGVAAAQAMKARGCDQLIVVCPTVVVRDQWCRELARLGYEMLNGLDSDGWPAYVHGVCVTYAQVASNPKRYRAACAERRTVAIFDEIHHAGERLAWGAAIATGFAGARLRLMLSGTPFRSDRDRIPFVRYDTEGNCLADFAYDYATAVRDGVCRPIEFHAHDGQITWRDKQQERTARFCEEIGNGARGRRLRAALDPEQPYLRALLSDAHRDLLAVRERISDAAALVVCDSQAHALAIDRLLSEITGTVPVLAMSDLPRAHQAIAAFADEREEWLVSVRMVSEGVDIPRLAVIAWATVSSTELLVRQVAGRALRGRDEHGELPALVHIPADPELVRYAERLEVVGGTVQARGGRPTKRQRRPTRPADPARCAREIDPTPFVEWFDRHAEHVGAEAVLHRCGWEYDSGLRMMYRWRCEGCKAHVLMLLDACHMAGIDFDELFSADEYAAAREYVNDPTAGGESLDYGAVAAEPATTSPRVLAPALPNRRLHAADEQVEIATPALPASPEAIRAAEADHQAKRGELFRLLGIYGGLQREVDPAYQLASAHRELTAAFGAIEPNTPDELLAEALEWIRDRVQRFARSNPRAVTDLARARRRQALAS